MLKAIVAAVACGALVQAPAPVPRSDWIQLFNGKNLDGWDVKISGHDLNDNFANTFRVEDGLLKVRYDGYQSFNNQFGHIFYKKPFSRYVVAVEYRFVGEQAPGGADWALRNSGIMIHSQSAKSMAKDQDFPISIEVQLLGGNGTGERPRRICAHPEPTSSSRTSSSRSIASTRAPRPTTASSGCGSKCWSSAIPS